MTKLYELKVAYDASARATKAAATAVEAAATAVEAAYDAMYVAYIAYKAELKKTRKENSND